MDESKRTTMKAMGGIAALGGLKQQWGGMFARNSGVQSGESVMTFMSPYGQPMYYQFSVTGSVRKLSQDPFGNVPAKAVTVDGEDDIKGCLVHGGTNGGADVYAVTGELSYGNLSGVGNKNGTGKVYVDGSDATSSFIRGTPPSSASNTDCDQPADEPETTQPQPESKVICDARTATEQVEITLQVSEKVYYQNQTYDGLTFIINPGDSASVPFDGELICFAVRGGDCDVTMQLRN